MHWAGDGLQDELSAGAKSELKQKQYFLISGSPVLEQSFGAIS
jgi:hypothetical protein